MRWEDLEKQPCSIARSLAVFGDRWTLLVLRECFMGVKKFADFQENLGISKTIVADRLKHLTDHGILEKTAYQKNPVRYKYRLTQKGLDILSDFSVDHPMGRYLLRRQEGRTPDLSSQKLRK